MISSDNSGEYEPVDLTRTRERFTHPVYGPDDSEAVIDLTDIDRKHTDVPEHVIEALRDMIVHEVVELEKISRPDPLAPISEQKDYTYRTAEMYGAVEALTRFKEFLERNKTEDPSTNEDYGSQQIAHKQK